MSKPSNTGLKGPAIAVALIVLCFVVYQIGFAPGPPAGPKPASKSPVEPEPPSAPEPKQDGAAGPAPAAAAALADVPVTKTWPTYHGGPELCGYSNVSAPGKPTVLWQYIAPGAIRQPVAGDDRGVYAATTDGWIVALDLAGQERWKTQLMRAAADGGVETTERLNAPIACFRSTVAIGSNAGIVHALDAGTGEPKWTYDIGGEVLGAVNCFVPDDASQSALLYAIERGQGVLHCINLDTGAHVWRTDPIARTDGSMAVADGTVVYGSCDFALHVYGAPDGKRGGAIALCGDCQVASGPAVAGSEIYSGSRSGHFYRADAKTGAIVWTNEDCTDEIFTTPAIGNDAVVFGSEDGKIYCLDRASGALRWAFESGGLPTSPIIAADRVLAGVDGELIVLSLETGEEVWRHEVSDGIAAPSIVNGTIVVGSEDGTVIAFGAKP
ncbi:MAG: PQQ-binding-like beta-propeller repeat protein [Candidatus Hydrogenedentes bacterium]|nr:PQQ-binding-like beta-propeller repeat protein [Candidatus Hydrogenedentota bacterium]